MMSIQNFENKISSNRAEFLLAIIALISCGIVLIYTAITSTGLGFGSDSINHYLFSRYCWQHPNLLLNLWAKPFFTIVSSPFSQFGYYGIKTFNILCVLLSGYLLFRIGYSLNWKATWTAIPFLTFTPVYFLNAPSGFTEFFFGLITVVVAFLLLKDKPSWAAAIVSFLPLVRSEGYLFLPILFVIFLIQKNYRAIPWLLLGLLIYSLAGWPAKDSFLWIFKNNPYKFGDTEYGSGSFTHFINTSPTKFGVPLLIVGILGIIYFLFELIKNFWHTLNQKSNQLFLFLVGGFILYFSAHSIFWGFGIYGSLGLTRVLAAIIPGLVFAGLYGIQAIYKIFDKIGQTFIFYLILIFLLIWEIKEPYEQRNFPFTIQGTQKYVIKSADWLMQSKYYPMERFFFINAVLPMYMDFDPFNSKKYIRERPINKELPGKNMPPNTILYWDSMYGPENANLPKENMLNSPYLEIIKHIKPEPGPKVGLEGERPFEIYFFERKANVN